MSDQTIASGEAPAKEVIESIIKTSNELGSLRKEAENVSGPRHYGYVPIDTFYEKVAPIARSNGLTWKAREVYSGLVEHMGSRGTTNALLVTYEFDLLHGPTGTIWGNFYRMSIFHPLQGAQTAGSAISYAEKQFMREVFKIVTGEQDADASDPIAFERDEPITIAPMVGMPVVQVADTGAEMDFIEKTLKIFLPTTKTPQDLTDYWAKNEAIIKNLKKNDKEKYASLQKAFKDRGEQFGGSNG